MPSGQNGEFSLICCIDDQSAVELHVTRLYTNSCLTTGLIDGPMNNIKEFLFSNTKKVLINGENDSNSYFYRFEFLKISSLASHLRNNIDIVNSK